MYDISGSAHFINKCDNGIVIHRNRDQNAGPLDIVQVIFAVIFTLCFHGICLFIFVDKKSNHVPTCSITCGFIIGLCEEGAE